MANVTITVQSLLNSATFESFTVADTTTVGNFKSTIESATLVSVDWFDLFFNDSILDTTKTLAFYSIISGAVLYSGNKIANLETKQLKQEAKLAIAQLRRQANGDDTKPYYRLYNIAVLDLLPAKYVGDTPIVDDVALVDHRPWID
jgi:hypothetical protein